MDNTNVLKSTPKDFFLQLASAVGLYLSAVSLINLLFEIINYGFPDRLQNYVDPYSTSVRWAIAMLLIIFPMYLWLLRVIEKDVQKNLFKKQLGIRRWLSYLTLFVAGVTIAIDLVVLINSFLGGELSTRFVLKVFAVLVVAAVVFGYYLYDLRRDASAQTGGLKKFMLVSVVFVLASLVGGFLVMGSPGTARKLRFDEGRVNDLSTIQWQIVDYWQRTGALPKDLDSLKDQLTGFVVPTDPDTNAAYEFKSTGKTAFTLCASFSLSSDTNKQNSTYPRAPVSVDQVETWQHTAGKACFNRTIDPSRYPPRSNLPTPIPVKGI